MCVRAAAASATIGAPWTFPGRQTWSSSAAAWSAAASPITWPGAARATSSCSSATRSARAPRARRRAASAPSSPPRPRSASRSRPSGVFERFEEEFGVDPGYRKIGYLFLISDPEDLARLRGADGAAAEARRRRAHDHAERGQGARARAPRRRPDRRGVGPDRRHGRARPRSRTASRGARASWARASSRASSVDGDRRRGRARRGVRHLAGHRRDAARRERGRPRGGARRPAGRRRRCPCIRGAATSSSPSRSPTFPGPVPLTTDRASGFYFRKEMEQVLLSPGDVEDIGEDFDVAGGPGEDRRDGREGAPPAARSSRRRASPAAGPGCGRSRPTTTRSSAGRPASRASSWPSASAATASSTRRPPAASWRSGCSTASRRWTSRSSTPDRFAAGAPPRTTAAPTPSSRVQRSGASCTLLDVGQVHRLSSPDRGVRRRGMPGLPLPRRGHASLPHRLPLRARDRPGEPLPPARLVGTVQLARLDASGDRGPGIRLGDPLRGPPAGGRPTPRASRIPGRDAPRHARSDGCARASAGPGRPPSSGSTAGGSSARPAPSWPMRRSGIFKPRCASSTIPSSSRPTRRLTACACRMRWPPSSSPRAMPRGAGSWPGRCRSGPICGATSRAS